MAYMLKNRQMHDQLVDAFTTLRTKEDYCDKYDIERLERRLTRFNDSSPYHKMKEARDHFIDNQLALPAASKVTKKRRGKGSWIACHVI